MTARACCAGPGRDGTRVEEEYDRAHDERHAVTRRPAASMSDRRRTRRSAHLLSWLTPIGNLLVAQLAFFACSLTVVLIVPAAVALQRTTEAVLIRDENAVLRCFLRELRSTARSYLLPGLVFLLMAIMLATSLLFWGATGGPLAVLALVILIPLAGLLIAGYVSFLAESVESQRPGRRALMSAAITRLRMQPLRAGAGVVVMITWGLLVLKLPTAALVGSGLVPALLAFWLRRSQQHTDT